MTQPINDTTKAVSPKLEPEISGKSAPRAIDTKTAEPVSRRTKAKAKVSQTAGAARDKVSTAYANSRDKTAAATSVARDRAVQYAGTTKTAARDNPLAAVAIIGGVATAAAVATTALIQNRRAKNQPLASHEAATDFPDENR